MRLSSFLSSLLGGLLLLVSSFSVRAQSIDAYGTDETFDFASWNIEWFGSSSNGPNNDAQQYANVLNIIQSLDIDLWALQEIADANDFNRLLRDLGTGYHGTLATNSTTQRIGFIWKTNVVRLNGAAEHILENFRTPFASRPPLQIEASVTIGNQTEVFTFITVQMKAFSDVSSYERRVEAAQRLKNHIDFGDLESEKVIVLGDFNDRLTRSITTGRISPYTPFLEDTDDYFFPSLIVEQNNDPTFIGGTRSTIDHILISDEVLPFYFENSADALDELTAAIPGFSNNTSDHLPIAARLFIPETNTNIEPDSRLTAAAELTSYPNPFSQSLALHVYLPHSDVATISVYDIMGRLVFSTEQGLLSPGQHTLPLALDKLASGFYVVRFETPHVVLHTTAVRQ